MKVQPKKHLDRKIDTSLLADLRKIDQIDQGIENGHLSEHSFSRLKCIEMTLFTVEVLVYVLSFLFFELKLAVTVDFSDLKNIILQLNFLLVIMRLILILLKTAAELNYRKERLELSRQISFWETQMPKTMFIEVLWSMFFQNTFFESMNIIIILPGPAPEFEYKYDLNDFMAIASIARAVFAIRYMKYFFKYNNNSSARICGIFTAKSGLFFEIRCFFQEHPLTTVSTILITVILNFAFLIRMVEYDNPVYDFTNYYNCIWFVAITMLTIGYGDYNIHGLLGRVFAFIVSIMGLLLSYLITVILTNKLEMNFKEDKVLEVYSRSIAENEFNRQVAKIAITLFKMRKLMKLKHNIYVKVVWRHHLNKLYKYTRKYHEVRRQREMKNRQNIISMTNMINGFQRVAEKNEANTIDLVRMVKKLKIHLLS